jgi:hypothetical protein
MYEELTPSVPPATGLPPVSAQSEFWPRLTEYGSVRVGAAGQFDVSLVIEDDGTLTVNIERDHPEVPVRLVVDDRIIVG